MRQFVLYALLCFVYLSCTKETKEVVTIIPPATTAQLKIDQVINDSTIVLKWSKFSGGDFKKYRLTRTATYLKNNQFNPVTEAVDSSRNIEHLSFTENKMPLAKDVTYTIWVSKDTTVFNQGFMPVATVTYQRPNSLVFGSPKDVLINTQQQRLYITEQNKIYLLDYNTGRIITSKDFPVTIGFCSLGDFNGTGELYVPAYDGWLQILDATTLQLKDRIYVAGETMGSALAVNGKLYVSSSDRTGGGGYSNCVKVYDRATKILIGRTGYWDHTRLTLLEGSSVEMIDLTTTIIPVGLSYYQFSAAGVPVLKKEDSYHGDYAMDVNIVRSFPDGSRFITSGYGTIFNRSLVFDRYIKQFQSVYSDFAFNANGSNIYAAYATQKKIDVVTYPATTTISSYNTAFYPYKIFREGNSLICVSKTQAGQQSTYLLIEKVTL